MDIGSRVKYLRKDILDQTQEDFAKTLGLGRSTIGNIENGTFNITDQTIRLICKEFHVREEWLRDGDGEPLVVQSRNDKLLAFVNDVMSDEDNSFRKNLVDALADLSVDDWHDIEEFAKKLLKKD